MSVLSENPEYSIIQRPFSPVQVRLMEFCCKQLKKKGRHYTRTHEAYFPIQYP
jgi:hypothetical protein